MRVATGGHPPAFHIRPAGESGHGQAEPVRVEGGMLVGAFAEADFLSRALTAKAVTFCASSGLNALIGIWRRTKAADGSGSLTLAAVPAGSSASSGTPASTG